MNLKIKINLSAKVHAISKTYDDVEREERLFINAKSEVNYEIESMISIFCNNTTIKRINIGIVNMCFVCVTFKRINNDYY